MIWLVGKNGMLGSEIAEQLQKNKIDFVATGREVDVTDETSVQNFWQKGESKNQHENCQKIDWLINCTAYTAVEKAETDQDAAHKLNVCAAKNLAKVAEMHAAKLIHFSTDYVFGKNCDKANRTPFGEDEQKNPLGVYGATKSKGEDEIQNAMTEYYILRTAWLYGKYGKGNFVRTMLKLMNEHDEIKVVADQFGTPTFAGDLADVTLKIILANESISQTQKTATAISTTAVAQTMPAIPYGIYNYTNAGACSWFDFATEIYALGKKYGHIKNDCRILPCTTAEYGAKVERPAYSVLSKEKIKNALRLEIADWRDSLEKFLQVGE